jgi:hypothetical protein
MALAIRTFWTSRRSVSVWHTVLELRKRLAQARQAGGDLLPAAPRGPVRRILDLTGLIDVFSVRAGVDEAVQAAGCSRPW